MRASTCWMEPMLTGSLRRAYGSCSCRRTAPQVGEQRGLVGLRALVPAHLVQVRRLAAVVELLDRLAVARRVDQPRAARLDVGGLLHLAGAGVGELELDTLEVGLAVQERGGGLDLEGRAARGGQLVLDGQELVAQQRGAVELRSVRLHGAELGLLAEPPHG